MEILHISQSGFCACLTFLLRQHGVTTVGPDIDFVSRTAIAVFTRLLLVKGYVRNFINNVYIAAKIDFIQLGCCEKTAALTYQVYMELSEVKRMFDINYKFDSTLNRIYLTARDSKSRQFSVFLPICSSENISFSMMEKMLSANQCESINFAIVSADSTCVYYEVMSGLPEINLASIGSTDRTQKHDHELQSKRTEIEEALKK